MNTNVKVLVLLIATILSETSGVYTSKSSLKIGLLLSTCQENSTTLLQTYKNSAVWVVQRLNYLEATPFTLQLNTYESCMKSDVYNDLYDVLKRENDSFAVGVISVAPLPEKAKKICDAIDVTCASKGAYTDDIVKAAVSFLDTFSVDRFLTVVAPDEDILEELGTLARLKGICIGRSMNSRSKAVHLKHIHGRNVIFGSREDIYKFINVEYKEAKIENAEFIFVSLDGLPLKDLPDDSYIISPVLLENSTKYEIGSKLLPTTILFEIANPLLNMITNISADISINCNNQNQSKLACFYEMNSARNTQKYNTPFEILTQLKIESLMNQFIYNILKVGNTIQNTSNAVLIGNYSIFKQNTMVLLTDIVNDTTSNTMNNCSSISIEECFQNCVNFDFTNYNQYIRMGIWLKTNSWVYAFLSLSTLGVIVSLSIIIFLFVRLCKGDVFEGNPTLSILMLLLLIFMYASIIPFSIDTDDSYKDILCLCKVLSVSLVFSATFSLLLSRCILLSTISKEVGFMAHVSGPVQTCLFFFMMAVQIALNMQFIDDCSLVMTRQCFLCLLSYNLILLFLLICTTFFIFGSERNYREGKYFCIAIFMVTAVWCVWIPLYWFYRSFEDAILCFGLVGTATALLGCIFIPRTYVMTISVARDKFTSALPALASAASAIDIYRASTQPIYDCINVAAINATNNTGTNVQQSDLYNCPSLAEEFAAIKPGTPVSSDKLTRF